MPLISHERIGKRKRSREEDASSMEMADLELHSTHPLRTTAPSEASPLTRRGKRASLRASQAREPIATTESVASPLGEGARHVPPRDVVDPTSPSTRATTGMEMELVEPVAWLERLTVCAAHAIALPGEHVDDDAAREQSFVAHAQQSVDEALRKLGALGVAWRRPANYYAEMMKSDVHMHKVREELQRSEDAIRRRAQRRQQTHQKKFSKELKSEQAKKEAERKRQLAIAVESAKRRSAKRMKEEAATSRLFGAALARDAKQSGRKGSRRGGGYEVDDDDEGNYYETKDAKRSGKRNPSSGNKSRTNGRKSPVAKRRPGKLARRKKSSSI